MTRPPTVGVVTIVSGRRTHLQRQLAGLSRQQRTADQLVIVRMDDEPVPVPPSQAGAGAAAKTGTSVLDVPAVDGQLPLAAARNAGVRALDTDVVILLDVDCIPGAGLVAGYARAAEATRGQRADGLICGVLRYLAPGIPAAADWAEPELTAGSRPHPARPLPEPGELLRDDQHELAWTTSLAMNRETFYRIGGFDERFVGYGAEDTDFGVRAREAGLGVWWTGDAVAYHQHHPSQSPPVQHLTDIVRNAKLFADLHGWFPMQGWLTSFDQEGLVEFDPAAGRLELAH